MLNNNLVTNETNLVEKNIENNEIYTIIEINARKYALKTNNVLEIIKVVELDYTHQMPSFVLGMVQFDGAPVAVIDLREIFKKERIIYGLSSRIVILKAQDSYTSIICDRVCDVKKIKQKNIADIPYQEGMSFFDGLYVENDEQIYVLNIDNIITYTKNHIDEFKNNDTSQKYIVNDENSQLVLKERKEFLNKVATEVQTQTALYDSGVSFSINDVKYYINMASVREFYKVNNSKFIKIPSTEEYIMGLVNIKGEYITVLDLRKFYNTSKTHLKEKSTIIILNSQEFKIGILADEICESMDVDFDEIIQNRLQKQEDNKPMEFVKDNEIYQVVDTEKLFQDERLTIA